MRLLAAFLIAVVGYLVASVLARGADRMLVAVAVLVVLAAMSGAVAVAGGTTDRSTASSPAEAEVAEPTVVGR